MSITRLETKLGILKRLDLLANLLKSFLDSKKQIRYIRKMLRTYAKESSEKNFLFGENEKDDIEYFNSEMRKIALRLQRAKKPDDFKRLSQALQLCHTELSKAITKTEFQLAEVKGKATLGNLFEKAKSIGDTITHGIENGIEKIKSTIQNSAADTEVQ